MVHSLLPSRSLPLQSQVRLSTACRWGFPSSPVSTAHPGHISPTVRVSAKLLFYTSESSRDLGTYVPRYLHSVPSITMPILLPPVPITCIQNQTGLEGSYLGNCLGRCLSTVLSSYVCHGYILELNRILIPVWASTNLEKSQRRKSG